MAMAVSCRGRLGEDGEEDARAAGDAVRVAHEADVARMHAIDTVPDHGERLLVERNTAQ